MDIKKLWIIFFSSLSIIYACGSPKQNGDTDQPVAETLDTSEIEEMYRQKGGEITGIVFKNMSERLMAAMQTEGVSGAVEYCNLAASPLVDSLTRVHQVAIKRTSHRLRNPANAPSIAEKAVLDEYLNLIAPGIPEPRVVVSDAEINYYAPIFLMDKCLKCHGNLTSDIAQSDYAVIKELYPDDQAIDFQPGELRGIWSLTFPRE